MQTLRPLIHGWVLVVADLAGIGLGALVAYQLTGVADQVWLQLPVAVVVTVALGALWLLALQIPCLAAIQPRNARDLGWSVAASVAWGIVIFVPVHFVTQGYITSLGNLVALALYQVPVNTVALFGSVAIAKPPLWERAGG